MSNPLTKEWRQHYVKRLTSMGLEQLGNGFCANVFQHPTMPTIAVKVVEATDKQFFRYMKWAKEHPWNPWVPQFYDSQLIDVVNERGYGIIFLERLERISETEYVEFMTEQLCCTSSRVSADSLREAEAKCHSDDLRSLIHFLLVSAKSLDLHQGNFLKRGQQIVFVDPVAGP